MGAKAVRDPDHAVLLARRAAEEWDLVVGAEERLDRVLAPDRLGVGLDESGRGRRARERRGGGDRGGDGETASIH
jgi:hypothetical protein